MNLDLPIDLDKVRRLREGMMRKLATGKDPVLAEMAREVLAGRITLRDAAFGAYREQVTVLAEKAAASLRQVSKEDLERAMEEHTLDDAIEQLGAIPDPEPEDEAPAPPARRPEPEEDDESILLPPPTADRPPDRPQRERWKRRWS
ncbi:hypothetical protein [Amycolatopsis keratiniphila]|uniref:hypothetical protein n=1 Tax=Amycolatopsis keratiniphila TaxID=129921 RepID=UPI00087C2079|nr:hypothetical protein [Amycolatopsis keratiniphila]OLZ52738.1 hypothetical protein BS330_22875 [Amycolatopsis keratiniphila subsp. nogabecina]SDU09391.1 hypothetical protein SAMN04489733_1074 [Amycolatopsis keratiniphila]